MLKNVNSDVNCLSGKLVKIQRQNTDVVNKGKYSMENKCDFCHDSKIMESTTSEF